MVKDHSESETGNPLPPRDLLFPIIYASSRRHTTAFFKHIKNNPKTNDPPHPQI